MAKEPLKMLDKQIGVPASKGAGASEELPYLPLTVRISAATRLTGLGRSKIYELIAAGDIETLKIGSATLIPFASLQGLIERSRRQT
jgi:excisionase family DNA binding protein